MREVLCSEGDAEFLFLRRRLFSKGMIVPIRSHRKPWQFFTVVAGRRPQLPNPNNSETDHKDVC